MKKDILKIAGVKSEKELYAKYGTEAEFMAKHGGAFKKAKMGASMVKKQLTQLTDFSNPPQAQDGVDVPQYQYSGKSLKSNLQKPSFMQPFNFNAPAYQQYQPMGMSDSRSEDLVSPSVYDITGMSRYYAKPLSTKTDVSKGAIDPSGIMQGVQNVIGGAQQWKEDANMLKKYKMWGNIADLSGEAMATRDKIKNKYVRPEDMVFDPNQLSRSYGTGYDVLASAEDGMQVGGNLTEIQNMYNPGDIYSDMGYEPLDDSNQVKQYQTGGGIFGNWQNNLTEFGAENAGGFGGSLGNFMGGGSGQTSGASKTLSGVGQLAGTALGGPLGGVIGSGLGSLVGGFIGSAQEKKMQEQQQKFSNLSGTQGIFNFQNQNRGIFEDGGEVGLKYLSHDWQPQVIAKFGDYDVKDLFRDDPTMDTLRTGGSLTHPKNLTQRALQTYDMGGELQVDGRGDIDFMGYNPETAKTGASGYIGISKGPSHDNGGFNVDYAGNKVEIEGGETVMEKRDGGSIDGENALNILGDMKVGHQGEAIAADVNKETLKKILKGRNIKDVKFKHLGNDIAKMTKRLNQAENRYINLADSSDGSSSTDLLQLNTAKAGLDGIKMQYKDLNNFQTGLIDLQTAQHDTAKEYGYDDTPKFLEDVKKGKFKQQAAMGGKFSMAQDGYVSKYNLSPWKGNKYGLGKKTASQFTTQQWDEVAKDLGFTGKGNKEFQEFLANNPKTLPFIMQRHKSLYGKAPFIDELLGAGWQGASDYNKVPLQENPIQKIGDIPVKPVDEITKITTSPTSGKFKLGDAYSMLYPYIKPLIRNPLDPTQLAGDMYSLASNQLEPVQAQQISPQLETPYSVSFQDQMNVNQADFNAMARQLGGNPAALSQLAAQKYAANTSVLGQQARANQQLQMEAYNRNRSLINATDLKNLEIRADQADKQAKARSNTKAQTYEALSSIGDKYAKNRTETLATNVQANMYPDYAFGPKGRIMKTGLTQFNIPTIGDYASSGNYTSADLQKLADAKKIEETKGSKTTARNGSLVKAIKNL